MQFCPPACAPLRARAHAPPDSAPPAGRSRRHRRSQVAKRGYNLTGEELVEATFTGIAAKDMLLKLDPREKHIALLFECAPLPSRAFQPRDWLELLPWLEPWSCLCNSVPETAEARRTGRAAGGARSPSPATTRALTPFPTARFPRAPTAARYGHTIGHALELTEGTITSHGEGVAIGMLGASYIANKARARRVPARRAAAAAHSVGPCLSAR